MKMTKLLLMDKNLSLQTEENEAVPFVKHMLLTKILFKGRHLSVIHSHTHTSKHYLLDSK